MATLKIEKKGPALFGFKLQRPDGSQETVKFDSGGVFVTTLDDPGTYNLDWEVRGAPDTPFSFKVSLNAAVIAERDLKISPAQREVGSVEVVVGS